MYVKRHVNHAPDKNALDSTPSSLYNPTKCRSSIKDNVREQNMTISRARIMNGKWTRKVPWKKNRLWRTDMFKSVLDDPRLEIAEFILKNGPTVQIPVKELRRVLTGGPDHYNRQIWGPFNIDPQSKTVNGIRVEMILTP